MKLLDTITALAIASTATSACGGLNQEVGIERKEPDSQCSVDTKQLNVTLDILEEKLKRIEDLKKIKPNSGIHNEITITRSSIARMQKILEQQKIATRNTCKYIGDNPEDISGNPELSKRLATVRIRLLKL